MKKSKKIMLCALLLISVAIIVICIINRNGKKEIVENENYYKVTYEASYNTSNVLDDGQEYEIVKDKSRLNKILNKIQSNDYQDIFDNNFFKSKNLLVIEGEIGSKINKFEINDKKVDIIIYCASPLTTQDEIWDYDLYLVPINKELNDINVETTVYPDRIY